MSPHEPARTRGSVSGKSEKREKKKSAEKKKEEEEEHSVEPLLGLLLEVPLGWPTSEDSAGFDSGFRRQISWEFPLQVGPPGSATHRLFCFPSSSTSLPRRFPPLRSLYFGPGGPSAVACNHNFIFYFFSHFFFFVKFPRKRGRYVLPKSNGESHSGPRLCP